MKKLKKTFQGKVAEITICCPTCKGTGKATKLQRQQKYTADIGDLVVKLYLKNKTLREIAEILKLKHPQTVKNIINQTMSRQT